MEKIMNTQENTLEVRTALQKGADLGERALLAIAEANGDSVAREIVEELTSAEVAAWVGEFDMTIPSFIHAYATPEQFAGAFARFGQRWTISNPEELEAILRERQRELEAFLCPMICQADEIRGAAMLTAFAKSPLAADTLIFLGVDRPGYSERLLDPTNRILATGTFEEVYARTSEVCPDLWEEMKLLADDLAASGDIAGFALEFCGYMHESGSESQGGAPAAKEESFLGI